MLRCRWWPVRLNPPGEFERHASAVADAFRGAVEDEVVSNVNVVYGFGPSAEVTFNVEQLDKETVKRLVEIAETLRTREGTRAEVLVTEVWLTHEERDGVEAGGTMSAYDA